MFANRQRIGGKIEQPPHAGNNRRQSLKLRKMHGYGDAVIRSRPGDEGASVAADGNAARIGAVLHAKRAQHAASSAGPVAEERALAQAKVVLAEATVATLQAKLGETRLTAPADGTIGIRVAEPGEIISPGKPVMTLSVDGERWFAFTLREDMLRGLKLGGLTKVTTADGRQIEARVTELRPLGEFAVWRAARAVGDHDLNSFRLRLDPQGDSKDLEPGMTVWLPRSSMR
jgi:HlyD family secretion protein